MSDNKVLSIVSKKENIENPNVVHIEFIDGTIEIVGADAFSTTEELPNFIALWKEQPYEVLGFINLESIKKIKIITREEAYGPYINHSN